MPITLVLLALGLIGFTVSAVFLKKKRTARILCMILCAAVVLLTAAWMGLTAYFVWAVGQDAPADNPNDPAAAEDGGGLAHLAELYGRLCRHRRSLRYPVPARQRQRLCGL